MGIGKIIMLYLSAAGMFGVSAIALMKIYCKINGQIMATDCCYTVTTIRKKILPWYSDQFIRRNGQAPHPFSCCIKDGVCNCRSHTNNAYFANPFYT